MDFRRRTGAVSLIAVFAMGTFVATGSTASASPWEVDWVKHAENPVIPYGPDHASGPCVLPEGDGLRMWLSGNGYAGSSRDINHSTSTDGVNWTSPEVNLARDTFAFWEPSVIKDFDAVPDERYKMWYRAHNGHGEPGDSWIEYATSPDGFGWTKHGEAIGSGPGEDFDYAFAPSVVKNGRGDYEMWYSANDGGIAQVAYATSSDGLAWDQSEGQVFGPDGTGFDSDGVNAAGMFVEDGIHYLLYMGWDGVDHELGMAWSEDGIHNWTRKDFPLLELGDPGDFDDAGTGYGAAARASMLFKGNEYWLWYTGYSSSGELSIGLATGIPEPASLSLLALGGLLLTRRRW